MSAKRGGHAPHARDVHELLAGDPDLGAGPLAVLLGAGAAGANQEPGDRLRDQKAGHDRVPQPLRGGPPVGALRKRASKYS